MKVGDSNNYLTMIRDPEIVITPGGYKRRYALFRCVCGKEKLIGVWNVESGQTKSCGCKFNELQSKVVHNYKHGQRHTRLYNIWSKMLSRCENPNYHEKRYYSEKGIKVCEDWHDFKNFYNWSMQNEYNDSLTIDRIDNDGDYCPENCRWVSQAIQNLNNSKNVVLTVGHITQTLKEWCDEYNLNYATVQARIARGWLPERALGFRP